jgi:hypothetical protein
MARRRKRAGRQKRKLTTKQKAKKIFNALKARNIEVLEVFTSFAPRGPKGRTGYFAVVKAGPFGRKKEWWLGKSYPEALGEASTGKIGRN